MDKMMSVLGPVLDKLEGSTRLFFVLYCPPARPRLFSRPFVLAFPRFALSKALNLKRSVSIANGTPRQEVETHKYLQFVSINRSVSRLVLHHAEQRQDPDIELPHESTLSSLVNGKDLAVGKGDVSARSIFGDGGGAFQSGGCCLLNDG